MHAKSAPLFLRRKKYMRRIVAVVSYVLMVTFIFSALAIAKTRTGPSTTWSGWRGADGQGVSQDTNFPTEWSDTKNIQWKSAIPGAGHSSPIVWGNRIFLTSDLEGEVVPGAKAAIHMLGKEEFKHPDWA